MTTCIEARGLRKSFGSKIAVDGIDLRVREGRVLGIVGSNGAGKSTALQAMLGLVTYQGTLSVLGRDPWTERAALMREVAFVTDVAVLPRWIRVSRLLAYVAGVHPHFDRHRAEGFLAGTDIEPNSTVGQLSKGMVTQLHLALVMATDAKLLVLDEPTLGLDLPYRKRFFDSLLEEYFDRKRTIVLATHEVDEVQNVLTDVVFLDRGRIVLGSSIDALEERFVELQVHPQHLEAARTLQPIRERQRFGRTILLFERADRERLAALGDVRTPRLGDLFVALSGDRGGH